MCLLDTLDGALMLTLYTSTSLAKDPIAILYYSTVLTVITVVVAVVIGVIQLLTLILHVAQPTGDFWNGVDAAGQHFDIIGRQPVGLSSPSAMLRFSRWLHLCFIPGLWMS